ncbi:MAG: POTRA domain-containing protein [Sediminibacterium sp.]|jgi:outer membrane protein assembly factor BamA
MFKLIKVSSFFLLSIICLSTSLKAQVRINTIQIEGNQRTKSYILLRELPYHVGDQISKDSLAILNTLSKQQLVNTSLFLLVNVTPSFPLKNDSSVVDINIQVKERWYFLPRPYFKWVDRNFSQWWNEQNRSLDRVNYGINLSQNNATGNNDKLVLGFIGGYTQQNIIRYQLPFFDKKLKFGLAGGWQNYNQKEINYTTENDKQVFAKTIDVVRKGYRANVNLLYRPNLFERHSVQLGYGNEELSDSGFLIQPKYLASHKKTMNYADLSVSFTKIAFDYNAYPTHGNGTELIAFQRFSKEASLTSIQFRKLKAHSFSKHNFIFIESNSIVKFLPNYNYLDSRLLGYGNLQMNGLEYYVVEGNAGSILKTSLHHALGSFTVKNPITQKFLPEVKYDFWLRIFTNLGYVYSEHPLNSNKLSNTLIRTAGIGLDVISIYDFVLKIDYSVNQLGDKGVYLHGGINF